MGCACCKAQQKPKTLIMIGLPESGKSTLMIKFQSYNLGSLSTKVITNNFEPETITGKSISIYAWDVHHRFEIEQQEEDKIGARCNGILFVVDGSQHERLKTAKELLEKYCKYESLKGIPLVIMSNKADMENSISNDKLTKILELDKMNDRTWKIFKTSGKNESGIQETFSWLNTTSGVIGITENKKTDTTSNAV